MLGSLLSKRHYASSAGMGVKTLLLQQITAAYREATCSKLLCDEEVPSLFMAKGISLMGLVRQPISPFEYADTATYFIDHLLWGPLLQGFDPVDSAHYYSAVFNLTIAQSKVSLSHLTLMNNNSWNTVSLEFHAVPLLKTHLMDVASGVMADFPHDIWLDAFSEHANPLIKLNDLAQYRLNQFLSGFEDAAGYIVFEGIEAIEESAYRIRLGELLLNLGKTSMLSRSVSGSLVVNKEGAILSADLVEREKKLDQPFEDGRPLEYTAQKEWVEGPLKKDMESVVQLMSKSDDLNQACYEQLISAVLREVLSETAHIPACDKPYQHPLPISETAGFFGQVKDATHYTAEPSL